MTDRKMNKADFYTSIIMLAFSIGIIVISLGMPSMVSKNESQWSNPGVVPAFIGFALLLLSGSMFVRSIMRGVLRHDSDNAPQETSAGSGSSRKKFGFDVSTMRILTTLALCIAYALLLGRIWFPLATFLFVFAFIDVFEFKRGKRIIEQWKTFLWSAVIGVSTAALVTVVFQYLFLVNLP